MSRKTPSTIGTRAVIILSAVVAMALLPGCGTLWTAPLPAPMPAALSVTSAPPAIVTPLPPPAPAAVSATVAPLQLMVSTPTPTVIPELPPPPADTALSLWVLHTADTRGYTAPCG